MTTRARTLLNRLEASPSQGLMDDIEALLMPREWPDASAPPLGPVRIHTLDIGRYRADAGALYGMLPRTVWQQWGRPDRQNAYGLHNNLLLIEQGEARILVDCGMGASAEAQELYRSRHKLAPALRDLGIIRRKVTHVILTHLHFAHAGGAVWLNRQGNLEPLFPKAIHYVHQRALDDWERHRGASPLFGPRPHDLDLLRPRLEVLTGETVIMPGVAALEAEGHAPGNLAVTVNLGATRAVYLGCTAPTARHLKHGLTTAWDADRERVLADRSRLVRDGFTLIFGHDPSNALPVGGPHG